MRALEAGVVGENVSRELGSSPNGPQLPVNSKPLFELTIRSLICS